MSIIEAYKRLQGQEYPQSSIRTLMHWTEWGGSTLYFLQLETMTKSSGRIMEGMTVPLFSRSIMMPNGEIFVCGGRKESNSYGLRDNYLIYPAEGFRWE